MGNRSWRVPLIVGSVPVAIAAVASHARLSPLFDARGSAFVPLDLGGEPSATEARWHTPPQRKGRLIREGIFEQHFDTLVMCAAISAALVVAAIVCHLVFRTRKHRYEMRSGTELNAVTVGDLSEGDIRDSLNAAQRALDASLGSRAVVDAWLTLESALASRWRSRRPSETSTEFVTAALASSAAAPRCAHTLSALYREAYFSGRDAGPEDVAAARALLSEALAALADGTTTNVSGEGRA